MNAEKWQVAMTPVTISIITNHTTAKTLLREDIDDLCLVICKSTWSPSTFKSTRNIENFLQTQLLVLDIDGGASMNDAIKAFSGYKMIVAPTRNHNIEKNGITCERFRLILFLSQPISDVDTYIATWKSAQKMLPAIDAACKDVSRQFFPSKYIHEVLDGSEFPITSSVIRLPVVKRLPQIQVPIPSYVRDFMSHGAKDWNNTLFKSAKLMQEAGYEKEEVIDLFNSMSNAQFNGVLDANDLKTIDSAFSKPGKYDAKIDWPDKVQTRKGDYVIDPASHHNLIYLMKTILNTDIKLNTLRKAIEINGKQINDTIVSRLKLETRNFGLKISTDLLNEVIQVLADDAKYHPFKDVIEAATWDGHDHIRDLFKTITIEGENHSIYEQYLRRWLIGTIARVYIPGQQNNVLVLLGAQAAGKSRWLERFNIAPSVFAEGLINPESKDDLIKTTQNIIFHLSELDSITRKKDAAILKSYLTASTVDVRSPYARYSEVLNPCCSFVASVNETKFLVDTTGNRRFLVIPVDKLNPTHNVNMIQVFAQALSLFKSGERFYFDKEEIVNINYINEDYGTENKMDYLVSGIESGDFEINANELLDKLRYKDSRNGADYALLGKALRKLGVEAKRKLVGTNKLTFYRIKESTLPKDVLCI